MKLKKLSPFILIKKSNSKIVCVQILCQFPECQDFFTFWLKWNMESIFTEGQKALRITGVCKFLYLPRWTPVPYKSLYFFNFKCLFRDSAISMITTIIMPFTILKKSDIFILSYRGWFWETWSSLIYLINSKVLKTTKGESNNNSNNCLCSNKKWNQPKVIS